MDDVAHRPDEHVFSGRRWACSCGAAFPSAGGWIEHAEEVERR